MRRWAGWGAYRIAALIVATVAAVEPGKRRHITARQGNRNRPHSAVIDQLHSLVIRCCAWF